MEMQFVHYNDLSKDDLYQILRLRAEVFVVEQDCVYLDLDGYDTEAWHVFVRDDGRIIACSRVFVDNEDEVRIGRVVVAHDCRRRGVATGMLRKCIEIAGTAYKAKSIVLDAQTYALSLYEAVGFRIDSDEFLEDGIPHYRMRLEI